MAQDTPARRGFRAHATECRLCAYAQVCERLFLAGLGLSIVYLIAASRMQKLMHGCADLTIVSIAGECA